MYSQEYSRKRHSLFFAAVVSLCLLCCNCSAQRRPDSTTMGREPTISLYIAETGEKKEIKLEEYIKGVIAAEMEPDWPEEALAAQAILARTFTLERIKSSGGVPARGTDASTDVEEFQAYDPTRINNKVRRAVEMTKGEVVKHNGKYIKAWFFADGGGKTAASAEEGLAYTKEPTPYIQSVSDPGSNITTPENKSWRAEFSLAEVRQAVLQATGSDPGAITEVSIVKKGPSGRAMTLKIGNATISGPAFRLALNKEKVRSTLFKEFKLSGGKLIISGKGFGHGVGMSQWGAKALAEQGKSPEEIIRYFFKNVQVVAEYR